MNSAVSFSLNLPGRGSSSIHKQVQSCYGCADEKPLFGFHRKEVEFEIIHVSKE
jgi:hypothetical protein